jgi:hypothetical protein
VPQSSLVKTNGLPSLNSQWNMRDFLDQLSESYSWGVYFRPGISHISILIGLLVDFDLTGGLVEGLGER